MKEIQKKSDYCYRFFNDDAVNGILSCGYLSKSSTLDSLANSKNDYYTCSVLLEGKGTFIDSLGNTYPVMQNSVFQCFPGKEFSIIIDPDSKWYEFYIKIGKSTFDALSSLNLLHITTPVFQIHLKPYLIQWFSELINQLKTTGNAELPEVLFVTQKLLINLHREDIRRYESNADAIIAGAKQMLYYRCNESIALEEIAASFHVSYEKFRKLFKQEVGISPIQYRLQSKFHFAQRLLYEGVPIKIVAAELGYNDPFTFSRQFKKYMGSSPSSFKNK
jgi:AraC-type DNA-binding domain-containing proteins